jgi:hypothetical protein
LSRVNVYGGESAGQESSGGLTRDASTSRPTANAFAHGERGPQSCHRARRNDADPRPRSGHSSWVLQAAFPTLEPVHAEFLCTAKATLPMTTIRRMNHIEYPAQWAL